MRRFLENACLAGAAILLWLTIALIAGVIGFSIDVGPIDFTDPPTFTDELGRECLEEHVNPETDLCP